MKLFLIPGPNDLDAKVVGLYGLLCTALDQSEQSHDHRPSHQEELAALATKIRELSAELEMFVDASSEGRPQGLETPSRIRTIEREIQGIFDRISALSVKRHQGIDRA
jgi:hypothetical protein